MQSLARVHSWSWDSSSGPSEFKAKSGRGVSPLRELEFLRSRVCLHHQSGNSRLENVSPQSDWELPEGRGCVCLSRNLPLGQQLHLFHQLMHSPVRRLCLPHQTEGFLG